MSSKKMYRGPFNTKSAQGQRTMQHCQQQQKPQDQQQFNQQHSNCNKALKMSDKKMDKMNNDNCNNPNRNKHTPLKTDVNKPVNGANVKKLCNKEVNNVEKNYHRSLYVYNSRTNQASGTLSKSTAPVSAESKKVTSGSWKCSDKRQLYKPSNNLMPQKSRSFQKQQHSQPLVQLPNENLRKTGETMASSRTYTTSICRPGILYSDVLIGPRASPRFVNMNELAPRFTNAGVGAGALASEQSGTTVGTTVGSVAPTEQNRPTLLKCTTTTTVPGTMPPKNSVTKFKLVNPDLSSNSFNKSFRPIPSMYIQNSNSMGTANGYDYIRRDPINGNNNAVSTGRCKLYGGVTTTNIFPNKQEMMPEITATTSKIGQGATTLAPMRPNNPMLSYASSSVDMRIQNNPNNAMPIARYNIDGITFGTGLEEYFPNQTNIKYTNNEQMNVNSIKPMPVPIISMPASTMPALTSTMTTNGHNCLASRSDMNSSTLLSTNSQIPMKSDAVMPCASTSSPEPFFAQMPTWNLIDVPCQIYPKFLRQFDDENYLKLEAAALEGLKQALQNNSKQWKT